MPYRVAAPTLCVVCRCFALLVVTHPAPSPNFMVGDAIAALQWELSVVRSIVRCPLGKCGAGVTRTIMILSLPFGTEPMTIGRLRTECPRGMHPAIRFALIDSTQLLTLEFNGEQGRDSAVAGLPARFPAADCSR